MQETLAAALRRANEVASDYDEVRCGDGKAYQITPNALPRTWEQVKEAREEADEISAREIAACVTAHLGVRRTSCVSHAAHCRYESEMSALMGELDEIRGSQGACIAARLPRRADDGHPATAIAESALREMTKQRHATGGEVSGGGGCSTEDGRPARGAGHRHTFSGGAGGHGCAPRPRAGVLRRRGLCGRLCAYSNLWSVEKRLHGRRSRSSE